MSFRCAGRLAAMLLALLLCVACGQVYRPVVIPCSEGGVPGCPVETAPTPDNFHTVFGFSTNTLQYPGGAMQIDVSGDTVIGETPTYNPSAPNLGDNPTYAAIFPNDSRVFVTSAGSVISGGLDVVSSFTPVFQSRTATGLGSVTTIPLPTGSQPVFVNTTQNNALYVANFGTNSVSAINTASNFVSNTVTVGTNPVALAEIPTGLKLYVANQGSNTVSSLNTTANLSQNPVTGFSGVAPVWVVARGDSQKVYVVTQGDGQLETIDTATDTVTSSLPVGAGANFIFFDPNLNRLYVTNPVTGLVYVFSDTGGANDTPSLLTPQGLAIPGLSATTTPACPGCGAAIPVSVTALLDGSRFYVASYQVASPCPDQNAAVSGCIIPSLTVFNASTFTLQYPSAPTLTLLGSLAPNQFAVAPAASCAAAPGALYSPSTTRFRIFPVAAEDSSRVYVSMCDAGTIADIITTGSNLNNSGVAIPADSLITDLTTPPAACTQPSCSSPATITAFSITSNVVTFQAVNAFAPGQSISIAGLTTGTYLDGLTLTVLSAGLSTSQFECFFTYPNVGLTTDSGNAVPIPAAQTPFFLLMGQ